MLCFDCLSAVRTRPLHFMHTLLRVARACGECGGGSPLSFSSQSQIEETRGGVGRHSKRRACHTAFVCVCVWSKHLLDFHSLFRPSFYLFFEVERERRAETGGDLKAYVVGRQAPSPHNLLFLFLFFCLPSSFAFARKKAHKNNVIEVQSTSPQATDAPLAAYTSARTRSRCVTHHSPKNTLFFTSFPRSPFPSRAFLVFETFSGYAPQTCWVPKPCPEGTNNEAS